MALKAEKGTLRVGPEGPPPAAELGFRPAAIVLWWAADADPRTTYLNAGGIGIWARGSADSAAWAADDRLTPGVMCRWHDQHAFVAGSDPTAPPELTGAVAANESGFLLETDGRTRATWTVHFLALGGSDVREAVVGRAALGRTGRVPVTGVGFRPDFLCFVGAADAGVRGRSLGTAIGFATGPAEQAASAFEATIVERTTVTRSAFRADAVVAVPSPDDSGNYHTLARLSSVEDDGFTLGCDAVPGEPALVSFLAVAGGRHAVVLGAAPRPRRRGTRVRVPFAPAAALAFTSGLDTMPRVRDLGRLCLGAASGRETGCISWSVRRREWPPEPRSRSSTGVVVEVLDTTSGRLHAAARARLDEAGIVVRWPLRDRNPRHVAYAVFGPAVADPPRRPLWRRTAGVLRRAVRQ